MKFNKEKYNTKRLQPRIEDIELNKCTHEVFDKTTGECAECGTKVNISFTLIDENEFIYSVNDVIDQLESMKMIVNSCMNKQEIKAAQKYFDMIPLLKNINTLYDICKNEVELSTLDEIDLGELLYSNMIEEETNE